MVVSISEEWRMRALNCRDQENVVTLNKYKHAEQEQEQVPETSAHETAMETGVKIVCLAAENTVGAPRHTGGR